jgi:hypothetical protein
MLIAVICFFTMLAMLDRALRIGRIELLIIDTRHELYSLRDLLRRSAISGSINANSPLFDYLDASLTWRAASLQHVTVYDVAGSLLSSHAKDSQKDYEALREELDKPENSTLKAIHYSFTACMEHFLKTRHKLVLPLFRAAVSFWERATRHMPAQTIKTDLKKQSIEIMTAGPKEFSNC